MALIRALNSGISGLRAFQTKMDVIGNNIANVETAGFKSSRVTFSELMNQNMGRSGQAGDSSPQLANQIGLGVRVASIDRDFSQGVMQSTGRTTDLALEGKGFFVVNNQGQNLLTRAGNFAFNKDGFLVDQGGSFVQGFNADNAGNILRGGATSNVRIDFENAFPPKSTNKVTLAGNLNSVTSKAQLLRAQSGFTTPNGAATLATGLNDLNQTTADLADGDLITFSVVKNDGTTQDISFAYTAGATVGDLINNFNTEIGADEAKMRLVDGMLLVQSTKPGESNLRIEGVTTTGTGAMTFPGFQIAQAGETGTRTMSTTIYDDLGNAHSLVMDFTQTGTNEWTYNARFVDGQEITGGATGVLQFDALGQLVSGSKLNLSFDPANGASPMAFEVELGDASAGTRFTQYAGANTAKVISQNGFTQGQLVDLNVDGEGRVVGIYNNGRTISLAQLAVAQVQNESGLEMIGDGLFRSTIAAGEMFINTATDFAGTNINAGALEGSNVDLAKEFTEMITSQRAYQSNARVISAADEMLIEAVNLKR